MNLKNLKECSVLVTGHTGFKGGWLAALLKNLGAKVHGYSLAPDTQDGSYVLGGADACSTEKIANICDRSTLFSYFRMVEPQVVFHLAAQPLVRLSYDEPVATYETNVLGTAQVLDACRLSESVRAVVVVTTDKCYWNREQRAGYVEDDRLGGKDPYSSSKACVELLVESFSHSYFSASDRCWVASARAGNVIGGADWAVDRLIPDIVKARIANDTGIIRNPTSIRPWQHVLDPLWGYILLAEKLLERDFKARGPWNFGPTIEEGCRTVQEMASLFVKEFGGHPPIIRSDSSKHEAGLLMLDASKAHDLLGWNAALSFADTVSWTAEWYRIFVEQGREAAQICLSSQIDRYLALLQEPKHT
jgi:CDP-glucose 4,6-dehydratase